MVGVLSPIVGTSKLLRRELGGERIDIDNGGSVLLRWNRIIKGDLGQEPPSDDE
jgi:hypothetical protein